MYAVIQITEGRLMQTIETSTKDAGLHAAVTLIKEQFPGVPDRGLLEELRKDGDWLDPFTGDTRIYVTKLTDNAQEAKVCHDCGAPLGKDCAYEYYCYDCHLESLGNP